MRAGGPSCSRFPVNVSCRWIEVPRCTSVCRAVARTCRRSAAPARVSTRDAQSNLAPQVDSLTAANALMERTPPADHLPEELPVLALREFVVFPYMVLPLFVARDHSIAAVEEALGGDRLILLVAQRNPETIDPDPDDLYRIGTVAMVMRTLKMADGRLKVLVQGLGKARIESVIEHRKCTRVRVSSFASGEEGSDDWTVEGEALTRAVRARVEELLPLKNLPPEVLSITTNVQSPGRLADLVASNLRLRLEEAQEVLEIQDSLAQASQGRRAAQARARGDVGPRGVPSPDVRRAFQGSPRDLPARTAPRDPERARRGRSPRRRARRLPPQGRGGEPSRHEPRGGDAPAAAPRADAPRRPRGPGRAQLSRLGRRAALGSLLGRSARISRKRARSSTATTPTSRS